MARYLLTTLPKAAEQKEADLYEERCAQNSAYDCWRLGTLYQSGTIFAKDTEKADELFDKSCAAGEYEACFALAMNLMTKDPDRALNIHEMLCEKKTRFTCDNIDFMLKMTKSRCDNASIGKDCYAFAKHTKDAELAKQYMEKACKVGIQAACSK